MNNKAKWIEFEELVAAIEETAAPRGAIVKRDDHIPDLITGEMRQVDVSIRFRAGITDILFIIECRDRNRKEDVRWIEEMVTKLRNLGAHKIILVSSTGFTEPAKLKAKHYSIDLRELSELSSDEIEAWFLPHGIVHLFRLIEDTTCYVTLVSKPDDPQQVDANEPLFIHKLVHTPFPAVLFINFTDMIDPRRFWAVPLDGSKTSLSLELDGSDCNLIPVPLGVPKPEGGKLKILFNKEEHEVSKVVLSFSISYEAAAFSPGDGTHHIYGAPGDAKVQHSQYQGKVFGLPVTFDHQTTDGASSSTAKFPSGLKLPSLWRSIIIEPSEDKPHNSEDKEK